MPVIDKIEAIEILDSRGRPTVLARLHSGGKAFGASVPAGASTGTAEAVELRDADQPRHGGFGCRRAVANVNGEINSALAGKRFESQRELDQFLVDLDATGNKSRLGANAILAASLAFARCLAGARDRPLFGSFAGEFSTGAARLPRPTVNLFSGGKHAGGQVEFQDVLIVPIAAVSMSDCLEIVAAVYRSAAELCREKYDARPLVGDEGGLAPDFESSAQMLADAVTAIERAGLVPGKDVSLAVDVASSHFYINGKYHIAGRALHAQQMIEMLAALVGQYPIISVEDGLAEDDWEHWPRLRAALAGRAITLGDDFLCTNPARVRRAVAVSAADALLLKVNQIGTISQAVEAMALARDAGWQIVVSARSGETEDDWLADLAVGLSGDFIKIGSITRSERLAKYNRLLEIEHDAQLAIRPWETAR